MKRRDFLSTVAGAAAAGRAASASSRPPNIVMIFADDLGYGDLGCYGGSLPTPNLDRMAAEGARFTQFYSANPVCSPSRAALMTGRYPVRVGVPRVLFPRDTIGLPDSETTIAQSLKSRGYRTQCIGKWHLGHLPRLLPTNRGFDGYFGIPYSNDMEPPVLLRDTEVVEPRADMNTLTRKYTEEAVRFIEGDGSSPFFVYMPHTMVHIPLGASERFRGKSGGGLYGDALAEMDWSVGEVLAAIRKIGAGGNTLVMFSSDNGPWYQGSPGRLRGRKGMTYEGGVRVPFIARFPGRIPKRMLCEGIGSLMDVFPTVARLAGAPLPKVPLDGIDIWPLLSGERKAVDREALLFFDNVHIQCARWRNWKLHLARHNSFPFTPPPRAGRMNLPLPAPELYDVQKDSDESYDAAPDNPGVVAEIQARVQCLIASFPDDVRNAYEATRARRVGRSPAGQVPYESKR